MTTENFKCHNCGASLDIDTENLIAFCPYCGERLLINDEPILDFLSVKEKTKQKKLFFDHLLERKRLNTDAKIRKEQIRKEKELKEIKLILGIIIVGFLFAAILKAFGL